MTCTTHHICDCQADRLKAAEAVCVVAQDIMREAAKHGALTGSTILRLTEAMEAYADTLPDDTPRAGAPDTARDGGA